MEDDIDNCIYVAVIDKMVVVWVQGMCTVRLEPTAFAEITGLVVDM